MSTKTLNIFFSTKNIERFKIVFVAGILRMMTALNSFIISLFIIRLYSPMLWGGIVGFLLFIDLGFSVINWGYAPYLDHRFTFHPNNIKATWYNTTISRLLLLFLFAFIVIVSDHSYETRLIVLVWCLMRFLYQSFDPLIQFEKKFIFSLKAEIIGLAILLIPIVFLRNTLTIQTALVLYALSFAGRAAFITLFYREFLTLSVRSVTFVGMKDFFVAAFPFLLLTLSAMLQQRIDLYVAAFYLSAADTAQYQVLLNLLLLCHVGASFLLAPFTKNIFRLKESSLKKLERKFIAIGFILALLSLLCVYMILVYGYHFEFSSIQAVMGYFYILMFYFYLVRIYDLRKSSQQTTVAIYSFVGCAVNLLASIFLIPRLGINGALLSGLITQVCTALLYHRAFFTKTKFRMYYA